MPFLATSLVNQENNFTLATSIIRDPVHVYVIIFFIRMRDSENCSLMFSLFSTVSFLNTVAFVVSKIPGRLCTVGDFAVR